MDTKQLFKALTCNKTTRPFFDGVFAKDMLSDIDSKPQLVICNTDTSEGKGKHWVAFFFQGETCEFFDSLGKDCADYGKEFSDFVERFSLKVISSRKRTQPLKSKLCGEYCLFFCFFKCKGEKLSKIVQRMTSASNVHKNVIKLFKICKAKECKFLHQCCVL